MTSMSFPAEHGLNTQSFVRYNRQLRGVLLDQQPWFVLRDLTKLTASTRGAELVRKLEPDQSRRERLAGAAEEEWLVSESGVYALLLLHLYPGEPQPAAVAEQRGGAGAARGAAGQRVVAAPQVPRGAGAAHCPAGLAGAAVGALCRCGAVDGAGRAGVGIAAPARGGCAGATL